MTIKTQLLKYSGDKQEFKSYFAYDNTVKNAPAILLVHDWSGLNEHVKERAQWLAQLGYVGFAVDMYGQAKLGHTNEEKMALMSPLINNRSKIVERLDIAIKTVQKQSQVHPNNIAILGFCFGGLCALDAARAGLPIKAAISFHGNLSQPNSTNVSKITAKILAMHGHQDPLVPPIQVRSFEKEMGEAKADWQLVIYGNALHSFTNKLANDPSFGTVYDALADHRSWRLCLDFLSEVFAK